MVMEVCQNWHPQIFSLHNIYHSWFWLNYFHGGVFDNLEEYIQS
jgi:hypothetical protein